jgi:hypothetical protein
MFYQLHKSLQACSIGNASFLVAAGHRPAMGQMAIKVNSFGDKGWQAVLTKSNNKGLHY